MILVSDHDIVTKLARLDLLEFLWRPFGLAASDVMIRANLLHVVGRQVDGASAARLQNAAKSFQVVQHSAPGAEALTDRYYALDSHKNHGGVDVGEAQLFLIATAAPDALLLTGDKKALKGLYWASSQDESIGAIYSSLGGRCVCFEMLLLKSIEATTYGSLSSMSSLASIDRWLANNIATSLPAFRGRLRNEVQSVRNQTGTLLKFM